MRVGVLILTVPLIAARAAAEPTSLDAVTEGLELAPDLKGLGWRAGAQAFAGMDRERAMAGVSLGGGVAWEKLGCRIVDVGA